ncbi:MAG: HAD family phosphatase [Thermoguttaceae bacterium]
MTLKFLYFDLGRVLVDFSIERMFRQIGDVAGLSPAAVREVIVHGGLFREIESGRLSDREFFEAFCDGSHTRPDMDAMARAASDIFELKRSMLPVVAQLREAGWPLGILSNTCSAHWEHCAAQYRVLTEGFDVHALSYRIGAVKPEPAIFQAAAELAGVRPDEIFFVDDIAVHIEGALAAGFDAVQYTTTAALAAELRRRGVRFNY